LTNADTRDGQLVEAVLRRDDHAVLGQMRQEGLGRALGVLRLDAEQDDLVAAAQPVRREGGRLDGEGLDRPFDVETVGIDRRDMLGDDVDEDDIVAGALEVGADRAADGAGAPDEDRRAHCQGPSMISRVSATATSQSASISSSGRLW
jgi:hypothetical protein